MKTFLNIGMLITLLFITSACGSGNNNGNAGNEGEGDKTIEIANYFAEEHPQNVALNEKFKPLVEENTDYTVEIFPNNELGDESQFTNSVRNGNVEMAIAGMGLQTAEPKIGAVEWPFLFENYDQANKVLNSEIGEEIGAEFEKLDAKLLGWTANGFRVVSSNQKVASMEDFQGLRLRMPDVPIFVNTGEALGASVQPMPMSEIFTALEQGVIDGQDNPYATLQESGWYEVQSDVLESRHMFSPNVYLMNLDFWNNLSEEEKTTIQNAADESSQYQWELAKESEEEVKNFLEEEGLEITVPDEAFKEEMVTAMDPVYEELYQKYDWAEEFINRINEIKE